MYKYILTEVPTVAATYRRWRRTEEIAKSPQKNEAMVKIPVRILHWVCQKEISLENHPLYFFSILGILSPIN
jgi:hypothetical protein